MMGTGSLCHKHSIQRSMSACDCNDDCYFKSKPCCIDKMFELSTACTDKMLSLLGDRFLVYNQCKNTSNIEMSRLCQSSLDRSSYSNLPVQISERNFSVHYKNVFCMLCNEKLSPNEFRNSIIYWNIAVTCDNYISPTYHVSFQDYITHAIRQKCRYSMKPQKQGTKCFDSNYNKCNITDNWKNNDLDIKYACVFLNLPRMWFNGENPFCRMCNPLNRDKVIHTTCNETKLRNLYTPNNKEKCHDLPSIQALAPYKNHFCHVCITGTSPTFKWLQKNCQMPNECRDIQCYPGRILTNNGCVPLLPFTSNLGYILSLTLRNKATRMISVTTTFLNTVEDSFIEFLQTYLKVRSLHVNLSCSKTLMNGTFFDIILDQKIFINEFVDRSFIEKQLINLTFNTFSILYGNALFKFVIKKTEKLYNFPGVINKMDSAKTCRYTNVHTFKNVHRHKYSEVSELLVCEQVEMDESEFQVDEDNYELTLNISGLEIHYDNEYILMSDKTARLCLDEYKDIFASQPDFESPAISVLVKLHPADTSWRRETAVKKLKLNYENESDDDNVSDSAGFEALDISANNDNETASDKFIVEKSGFLQYLLPEDEVMADRGFTIDDLLFPLRVKLNIPAFTKCKPHLSNEDLTTTRRIARVIHVVRAIRRLKVFKILNSTVPVSSLKNFDDILLVCLALVKT
ncbi:unnamed protein product [Mytilus coruscus]|uniref:DDE Tnp4 domain-containing protein n=1 Tax=Mytilus coruscus TaxID=42192 RepID=A0A6J8DAY2_MYTCO|nr:unnamed protein product [Mytilus coruscus]